MTPDIKEQYKQWGSLVFHDSKKRIKKSAAKVVAVFWNKGGVILRIYLEQYRSVNGAYYTELLT